MPSGRIQTTGTFSVPGYGGPTRASGLNTLILQGSAASGTLALQVGEPDEAGVLQWVTINDLQGVAMTWTLTTFAIVKEFASRGSAFRFSNTLNTPNVYWSIL